MSTPFTPASPTLFLQGRTWTPVGDTEQAIPRLKMATCQRGGRKLCIELFRLINKHVFFPDFGVLLEHSRRMALRQKRFHLEQAGHVKRLKHRSQPAPAPHAREDGRYDQHKQLGGCFQAMGGFRGFLGQFVVWFARF